MIKTIRLSQPFSVQESESKSLESGTKIIKKDSAIAEDMDGGRKSIRKKEESVASSSESGLESGSESGSESELSSISSMSSRSSKTSKSSKSSKSSTKSSTKSSVSSSVSSSSYTDEVPSPDIIVIDSEDEDVCSSSVDSDTSDRTIDLLGQDPLFLIMSQFFMSQKTGDNIATILEKLNENLEKNTALHSKK